jgi:hypothetical protein
MTITRELGLPLQAKSTKNGCLYFPPTVKDPACTYILAIYVVGTYCYRLTRRLPRHLVFLFVLTSED